MAGQILKEVPGTEKDLARATGAAGDGLSRAGEARADRLAWASNSISAATSSATTNYMTSVAGVFAAGDMPPRTVAGRVGHSRRPRSGPRRRQVPDGRHATCPA